MKLAEAREIEATGNRHFRDSRKPLKWDNFPSHFKGFAGPIYAQFRNDLEIKTARVPIHLQRRVSAQKCARLLRVCSAFSPSLR